jgi:hypothetical protein
MTELHLHHPDYDPDKMLDTLIGRLNVKTDVGLYRMLDIHPSVIRKIRRRRLGGTPSILHVRCSRKCTSISLASSSAATALCRTPIHSAGPLKTIVMPSRI